MIKAHADEISWYVNYITEDGFINVVRNGGSDHKIAPACGSRSIPKRRREGVFGRPIHLRKGKDANLALRWKISFVDIGAKNKEKC